jgi:Raf kinase inhibitor-like YbhB/YbcL family protein
MLRLSSPSFPNGGQIPRQHTIDGGEISPALSWSGLPYGAKSLLLVLVGTDQLTPTGPARTVVNWLVYNLQPSAAGIPLGANRTGLPAPARSARNDLGIAGYSAPAAPEVGARRYVFRLLALETTLHDRSTEAPDPAAVMAAVTGHVLDTAELTATYEHEHPAPVGLAVGHARGR